MDMAQGKADDPGAVQEETDTETSRDHLHLAGSGHTEIGVNAAANRKTRNKDVGQS